MGWRVFLPLIIFGGHLAVAQEVYRWESKDGEVHYTDDRATIPRGVKAISTSGAELGEVSGGPVPRPAPPPATAPPPQRLGPRAAVSARIVDLLSQAEAQTGRASVALGLLCEAADAAATELERRAVSSACGRVAVELIASGHSDDAVRFLRKGREIDPDAPTLRLANGELAYAQGDSRGALDEWEQGLRQTPQDPALSRRIEEVRRRSKAFGGLGVSSSKWVTVTFDGAEDSAMAQYVVKTIEDSRRSINELYGYTGDQRVEVILYPSRTFDTVSPDHPSWAGGLYDGRIHIPTGGAAKVWGLLGHTLLHEYGHRVLARIVGPRSDAPAWLNEGLAQLAPAGGSGPTMPCAESHVAPLRSLTGGFGRLTTNVRVSYFEAQHAVEFLIARYGRAIVPRLLHGMGEGASFEDAFFQVTNTRFSAFVQAFDGKEEH